MNSILDMFNVKGSVKRYSDFWREGAGLDMSS